MQFHKIFKRNFSLSVIVYGLCILLSYKIGQYLRAVTVLMLAGSLLGAWVFIKILTHDISLIELIAKLYNIMIISIIVGTGILVLLTVITLSEMFIKIRKNTNVPNITPLVNNISILFKKKSQDDLKLSFILLIITASLIIGIITAMIVFYDLNLEIILSDIYKTVTQFLTVILLYGVFCIIIGIVNFIKEFFFPNSNKKEDTEVNKISFLGGGGKFDGQAGNLSFWGDSAGNGGGKG